MSNTKNQGIAVVDGPIAPPPVHISAPVAPKRPRTRRVKRLRSSQIPWYCPTLSPEHGILFVLLGSVLTGSALAFDWTSETTWACIATFLGIQAEHPLVIQIKKRRKVQPRYALWALLYGSTALGLATWLVAKHPILWWVVVGAIAALAIDIWSVLQHKQKAIATEVIMFTAICLSTVFVYSATTETLTASVLGFWILNSLFFSSAVYTLKLRKTKTSALRPSLIYHGVAVLVLIILHCVGALSLLSALTFAIALLKLALIIWQRDWYCTCSFGPVVRIETYFALTYIFLAALTVLPARLPIS